jgi:hypothetical protein
MNEEEYTQLASELKNPKPKQYTRGIDTFQRAEKNMSIEGIMAATVITVDAYIWRDKGSDYEDFVKARDWLDWCIKCMKEDHRSKNNV